MSAAAMLARRLEFKQDAIFKYLKNKKAISSQTSVKINLLELSKNIGIDVNQQDIIRCSFVVHDKWNNKFYVNEQVYLRNKRSSILFLSLIILGMIVIFSWMVLQIKGLGLV